MGAEQAGVIGSVECKHFLECAMRYIEKSRAAILSRWEGGFSVELKADKSFVTEADKEAEQLLREHISRDFPSHGIIGEELQNKNPSADYQWIIDPIDGTQNFAHGIPTFGTVLGLHYKGVPLVGIIDHPALKLCYHGAKGLGSYCNEKRLHIRDTPEAKLDLNEIILVSTRGMFLRSGEEEYFDKFVKIHPSLRIYYDVFGHTRAIHGNAGAMVEFNVRIWDFASTQLLIEEAGGKYVEIRSTPRPGGEFPYLSAIYGKPKIVDLLLPMFAK